MIKDPTMSDLPVGKLIGKEIIASISTGLLYPLGIRKSKRRTERQLNQRTVVFVHGYLANPSCFLPLSLYLRAHGHKSCLFYSYSSSAGIEQAAIGLKEFLRKNVRGGRIDLVCHSAGGLVARCYLQDLGGVRRVDSCTTLGTPHSGTYNAYWLWSRMGRELRPDSQLIERLQKSEDKAKDVRFLSIVAGSDNIVIPRVFASNNETQSVANLGHMGLLFSPIAFQKVLRNIG